MTNFIGSLYLKFHHGSHQAEESTVTYSPTALLLPLALAQFLASYDTGSMNVAISQIVKDLGTTVTGVQSAISIFTLTMAALMIPGSKLSDIWGRKRCFVLGLSVYAVGAFLTAIAPVLGVMILGFSILEGIGSALMIPPIYILVTVSFSDRVQRAKAFAVISAAAGIGAASGPLIGGALTTLITWRVSYLLEVFAIFFILSQHRRIHDPGVQGEKPPFDLLGAVLSALGLVFIVLGVLQAGNYGWLKARKDFSIGSTTILHQGDISPVILFILIGFVFLGLFALHIRRREKAGRPALLQSQLFSSRTVNLGLVTQNMQWFTIIGTSFVVSVFLQISRGYNAIQTGIILSPATIGILLASTRIGRMTQRFSQRTIIRGGFLIAFIGLVLVLLLNDSTSSIWLFVPGLFLTGFGAGMMLTASVNVVQSALPDKDQGEISGVSRSVSNLGSSLGTAVAGAVLISALITGISSATAGSQVFNDDQKQQVNVALQGSVSAVSDAQIQEQLAGQPQEIIDEAVHINAHARDRALGLALLTVSLATLIGFTAAMFMPATTEQRPELEVST